MRAYAMCVYAYVGMLETIQGSTRRGGLMALYRGFGVSALAIVGYKALYFG